MKNIALTKGKWRFAYMKDDEVKAKGFEPLCLADFSGGETYAAKVPGCFEYNLYLIGKAPCAGNGFRGSKIAGLLISQNVWLTIIGMIIGLPVGVGALDFLMRALASEYELKTTVGALTYTVSIVLMLGVSLAVSFLVARKNRKIDMVEALKGAE